MNNRSNLLTVASGISLGLLLCGALLSVLCILDASLKLDLFSRATDKALYGVLWSCITLAVFGVCTTFVIGIRDGVKYLQSSKAVSDP